MAKRRLFVGTFTPLPGFEELKRELSKLKVEGKWVEPENLHLTFRFLGDVEEEKIPQIARLLRGKLKGAPPFRVEYRGLGSFSKGGIPKVLWVGVYSGEIGEVKRRVDQALMPFGYPLEEDFKPHVTLLRIKKLRHRVKFKGYLFKMREHLFAERREEKLFLIESRLTSRGPIYKPIEEFKLG